MLEIPDLVLCERSGRIVSADAATRALLAKHCAVDAAGTAGEGVLEALDDPARGGQSGTAEAAIRAGTLRLDPVAVTAEGEDRVLLCVCDETLEVPGSGVSADAARYAVIHGFNEGIVHDLRSPLNSLAMNAEMLRLSDGSALDADAMRKRRERYANAIVEEVARLDESLKRLVACLAPATGGESPVSMSQVLERARTFAAPALRSWRVEFSCADPGSDPAVRGDAEELVLIFLILMLAVTRDARPGDTLDASSDMDADRVRTSFTLRIASERGAVTELPPRYCPGAAVVTAARMLTARGGHLDVGPNGERCLHACLPIARR